MAEIRDIRPTDPLWQKRPVDKPNPDADPEKGQQRKRRRDDPQRRDRGNSRGNKIDEFA